MGLSEFPSFNSEAALRRELERQGFLVTLNKRGGAEVRHPVTGAFTTLHLSTVTHAGKRSKLALQRLTVLGFKPPAQYDAENKALKAITEAPITEPPTELEQKRDPYPDPERLFQCDVCAVERCPRCKDQGEPCAFSAPVHLGRHRKARHPEAPALPSSRKARSSSRSGRVRTRTDPSVIRDPFTRLAKQLFKQMQAMNETAGQLIVVAAEHDKELEDLRRFKKEIEDQTGRLYDITTRPKR